MAARLGETAATSQSARRHALVHLPLLTIQVTTSLVTVRCCSQHNLQQNNACLANRSASKMSHPRLPLRTTIQRHHVKPHSNLTTPVRNASADMGVG